MQLSFLCLLISPSPTLPLLFFLFVGERLLVNRQSKAVVPEVAQRDVH